jgi:hypothetical protein
MAQEFSIPMLLIKPSDIFDMHLGEAEKDAHAVFVSLGIITPVCIHFKQIFRILLIALLLALYSLTKLIHYLVLRRGAVMKHIEPW